MSIHAVQKNMAIDNVVITYRDRPQGSVSKLNTFSDGRRVLGTIFRLFRTYRPFAFFSSLALILFLLAGFNLIPVLITYAKTGLVPQFPTLIVCGFAALAGLQALFTGVQLQTIQQKNLQDFELALTAAMKEERRDS